MNFEMPQFLKNKEETKKPEDLNKWTPEKDKKLFVKRSNEKVEEDWALANTDDDTATVYKLNPENSEQAMVKKIPLSKLEKINNKENIDFLEAGNLENVYKLIEFQDGIKTDSQEYTAEMLAETVDKVIKGELNLNALTRKNNLRFAIEKIIFNDKK